MVYTYTGSMHIHSNYSDGTGTIKEIATAAKKAGLSWIIITDHNTLTGRNEEGFYEGVAVIVEQEISSSEGNHYLALGINEEISPSLPPEEFIQKVNELGGFGFIAHPDENIDRKNEQPPLRWDDWSIKGFTGIEIWNHLSDWVDNFDMKSPLQGYQKRNEIISGPTFETLCWWDKLNNETEEIVPAIGGGDIHALEYGFSAIKVKIFPYYDSFKYLVNHLFLREELSDNFEIAKRQILTAIRSGQNIIENKYFNKTKEIPIFCIKNDNETAYAGENIHLTAETEVVVNTPQEASIFLYKNGELIQEIYDKELVLKDISFGKYRAEVYLDGDVPWIFTNPIVLE